MLNESESEELWPIKADEDCCAHATGSDDRISNECRASLEVLSMVIRSAPLEEQLWVKEEVQICICVDATARIDRPEVNEGST